jgi:hypothetical protein
VSFRGLSPKSFDGRGNYTFGVNDQLIFPSDYDKIDAPRGFDITIVTSGQRRTGRAFLRPTASPSDRRIDNGEEGSSNQAASHAEVLNAGVQRAASVADVPSPSTASSASAVSACE